MPNLRYTARGRPQILQRDSRRVENLGTRRAFAIFDLLAMRVSVRQRVVKYWCSPIELQAKRSTCCAVLLYAAGTFPCCVSSGLNGMPSPRNNSRASSFLCADVTIVTFIPCTRVYLSGFNSGNT